MSHLFHSCCTKYDWLPAGPDGGRVDSIPLSGGSPLLRTGLGFFGGVFAANEPGNGEGQEDQGHPREIPSSPPLLPPPSHSSWACPEGGKGSEKKRGGGGGGRGRD